MKNARLIKIKKIITSHYMLLVLGCILFLSGILETTETVLEQFLDFEIGAHHGIMVFGFAQILMAFVHIIEGLEDIVVPEIVEEVEELEKESKKELEGP